MKVEPTIVRADNGYAYATIEGHGKIFIGSLVGPVAIDTGDVPQLCECLTYAAKCPADARFFRPPPPKPLQWTDHSDWCSTAGEYAILRVDSGTFYELFHRGHWLKRLVTMRSARDAAQAHADKETRHESR